MCRLNRLGVLLGIGLLVAGGIATAVRASGLLLDTTFDSDGIVITDLGGRSDTDVGNSLAIQADGKIVVAGYSDYYGGNDFALARYNTNGTLDTTFDSDGIVFTNVGGGFDIGNSLAIQADGKIIVAGYLIAGPGYDFALVRYNTNGTLDTTFDSDGIITTNVGGPSDFLSEVVIQADGKIVVGGYSDVNGGVDFALVRYNTNGTLDTTFDSDGIAITNLGGTDEAGVSVAMQADGKIVFGGYSDANGGVDFALVRYNSNGSLDTSFDSDGIAFTNLGGTYEGGNSLVIQADGKIVIGGYSDVNGGIDFSLVRYNTNGSLDTSFDSDGIAIANLGGTDEEGMSVAMQADGKIVFGGYSDANGGVELALLRYNSNGSLDTSFDSDGIAINGLGGTYDGGNSLLIQADGKIVVGGYSYANGAYDFAVARFDAPPLTVTLAASSTTSNSVSITFTVTGTGTIDCTTLSATPGVDFGLTGITAITAITQTSPTECTIAATSSAIAGGAPVSSTLTAASTFSVGFTNGNFRTTISGSPQSVFVSLPAPETTTTTTIVVAPSLPPTGSNSSTGGLFALVPLFAGFILIFGHRTRR